MVANKVTKTNRFQKRTAAKTAVVKNDGDEKKRTKTKTTERGGAARHRKPMSGSLMFTTLLTICFVFIAVIVIVVCILCSESLIFSSKQSLNQPDSKPEYDPPEFPLMHRNSKLL